MSKRIAVWVMTVCLVIPMLCVAANAGSTETENFLPNYTLTGDAVADMIAIAMAQEGRTGKQFGYSDQWCAYFISDLARLVGETAAIPPHGRCVDLYARILNAGGKITTSNPKPGDICFINWKGDTRMAHVELVYKVEDGMVYTVGGNTGGGDTYKTRKVARHAPIDSSCILEILRPDYGRKASQIATPPAPRPPETYNVYFNAEGGAGIPDTQKKTENVPLKLSSAVPQRVGYWFIGWVTKKGTFYRPGDIYDQDYNVNLYAQWKKAASADREIRIQSVPVGERESRILIQLSARYRHQEYVSIR